MKKLTLLVVNLLIISQLSFSQTPATPTPEFDKSTLLYKGEEKHLSNVKQLTFGGDNAEAYFSFDSKSITFQNTYKEWGNSCDQIYYFKLADTDMKAGPPQLISTGKGRTTCAYFLPGDSLILYASTHEGEEACPALPAKREDGKYVWAIYPDFDIYVADLTGKVKMKLTNEPGYDAEGTVSPDGKKIVFTSMRSGDLELYTMDVDGKNVKQVTSELGYDGGAFFSPDSKKLIFRASRPTTEEEVATYKALLEENLVQPTHMELYVCNVDGSDMKKITNLPNASWAPFFHPSGKQIIFSSNHASKRGLPFNLWMVDLEGKNLRQITFDSMFDAFPMFSPDGKKLIFSSNRNNNGTKDTNLFIADWND
ncbi:MAG: PD40 domain-containing protein [Bacteroidetes bacterium]|nr:PD40 domain-containing protein [Bacteroidota bacterium]MBK9320289.1 PD40 domain-containing protein [Bacteroidota bacterium]